MSNQGGIDIGSTFALAPAKEIEAARRGIPDVCGSLSAMGTTVNIRIMGEVGGHLNDAIACAFREITLIEEMMTTHDETSMLSAVNRAAGNDMIEVDRRVIEVARAAIESAAKSRGLFDPTILPLLKAWGFREEAKDIPKSVEKAIERVGYNQISIEGEKLGLQRAGAGLDFGGIAKGYAVDRAVAILRGWGIRNAIVEAGGDLYVLGKPDDAAGWKIGVKNPIGPGLCAVFELADRAVATSGNYATRRVENARAMTDTFDPRTGEPVETFLSTTACAPTCMEADAASTAIFCAGRGADPGLAGEGISALNILRENKGLLIIPSGEFPPVEIL